MTIQSRDPSLQPLLIDALKFNRFMGKYFLLQHRQYPTYWLLTLSDSTDTITVECHNPVLMQQPLHSHQVVHVEAASIGLGQSRTFHCKNLIAYDEKTPIGQDLSVLPRALATNPENIDTLLLMINHISEPLLRDLIRQVLLIPAHCVHLLTGKSKYSDQHGELLQEALLLASVFFDEAASYRNVAMSAALLQALSQHECISVLTRYPAYRYLISTKPTVATQLQQLIQYFTKQTEQTQRLFYYRHQLSDITPSASLSTLH
jgi:3'-5' exoribonuclease